jgi:nucleotide-binding universal stress UspA family protein
MKILVPVDGSKYSEEALKIAIDYAKTRGANICLLSVAPFVEGIDLEISASEREKLNETFTKRADYIVQQACGILAGEDVIATCRHVVASSSIADAIIDYADKENIDLIIIGSRGLGKSSRFKMGSVASKVVKHAPCSVYVVKMSE